MGPAITASHSAGQHLRHDSGRIDRRQRRSANKEHFVIIEDEEGPQYPRISAVDAADVEIAGAFQPPHLPYWLLYVTPMLATTAGVEFLPDHLRLRSRDEARNWVHLVARLYAKAAS
jgi:hypothetical protein